VVVVCRVVCEGALPRIVEEQDAEDLEDWELDPGSAKVTLLAPLVHRARFDLDGPFISKIYSAAEAEAQ
jgi:hypothetical protein